MKNIWKPSQIQETEHFDTWKYWYFLWIQVEQKYGEGVWEAYEEKSNYLKFRYWKPMLTWGIMSLWPATNR